MPLGANLITDNSAYTHVGVVQFKPLNYSSYTFRCGPYIHNQQYREIKCHRK